MPKKTFVTNEVLTAADVNNFLMNQAVQTYETTAARSLAVSSATEGLVTYLQDSNRLDVATGSSTYRGITYRTTTASTGATYTVSLDDANTLIYATGTPTVTVPDVFGIGDAFEIVRGGGNVILQAGTGVTSWSGVGATGTSVSFRIDQQYSGAQVIKVAANSYVVIGRVVNE